MSGFPNRQTPGFRPPPSVSLWPASQDEEAERSGVPFGGSEKVRSRCG